MEPREKQRKPAFTQTTGVAGYRRPANDGDGSVALRKTHCLGLS